MAAVAGVSPATRTSIMGSNRANPACLAVPRQACPTTGADVTSTAPLRRAQLDEPGGTTIVAVDGDQRAGVENQVHAAGSPARPGPT